MVFGEKGMEAEGEFLIENYFYFKCSETVNR